MRGRTKLPLVIAPGGVDELSNVTAIPPGKLLASSNFVTRNGVGRPRPGYAAMGSAVAAADRVIGFGSRGSASTESNDVVHTLTAAYNWTGSTWSAITGTWTASAVDEPVRFAQYIQSGVLWLLRINPQNAVNNWTGTGSFAVTAGSPPTGRDITVTNGRALVARAGGNVYRYQWSGFNDVTSWPAGNTNDLSETPDEAVGCRAFGPLSAACYKEDSVWLATAQSAAAAFQFQLIANVPGPVSPSAIIPYRGVHYWLAKDNAIYRFDGSRVDAVGQSLATTMANTFDWPNRMRTHGFVLPTTEGELWFVYPLAGDATNTRAISFNLTTGAMTPHTLAHGITASNEGAGIPALTWDSLTGTWDGLGGSYATWDAMGSVATRVALIGDVNGNIYRFNSGATDAGTAIPWAFTHGWRAPTGADKRFYFDGIESYWAKTTAALTVTVGITVTNDLSDSDSEVTGTFDISTASNHLTTLVDTRGTWLKIRHAASSATTDTEHRGAQVNVWEQSMR